MAKGGEIDATRAEYNAAFGSSHETPDTPETPDAVIHVWPWWKQLDARRKPGFDSMEPITYGEIGTWSSLTRTQITPAEIGMLIQMDDAYLRAVATERKGQRDRDKT